MTYDIIGIGIGPFNLGLAALTAEIPGLTSLFVDEQPAFHWHPGLLLPAARLQVPYYADLVTLVNPCSPFSYFAFLHAKKRLFRFAIHDNPFPLRREYNEYCQWVAEQLPCLRFGYTCTHVYWREQGQVYAVQIRNRVGEIRTFHGKHLVIGTGTKPSIPSCVQNIEHPALFHASEYLFKKESLLDKEKITIIGSGQSAAEIFQDLLSAAPVTRQLAWFTRSPRFFPMEYAKLTLEMTSPDYIDYFYALDPATKKRLVRQQDSLYKGINEGLISGIYDQLYLKSIDHPKLPCTLATNCELQQLVVGPGNVLNLRLEHTESKKNFSHSTQALILATGYQYGIPPFLESIREDINWSSDGNYAIKRNYSIDRNNTIFVQNAELHTHGFNSADLGMGPYRNAVIVNQVLGRSHFELETGIAFQTFGAPDPG